jgi:hypothetical protein
LNWRREDAVTALTQLSRPVGIFFYRGDSSEGSDMWWLFHSEAPTAIGSGQNRGRRQQSLAFEWEEEWETAEEPIGHVHEILKRLTDGGLLGTDGSKGDNDGRLLPHENPYSELCRFLGERNIDPGDAMQQAQRVTGPLGHSFECIGCIDRIDDSDKGPTLIWQVRQPTSDCSLARADDARMSSPRSKS